MRVEVYFKAGQAQERLTVVADALELAETTEKRFCEVELTRLKGEGVAGARNCSLKGERERSVKRAEVCFAREMQRGETKARDMLVETIPWFETETDIVNLQDARVILA